MNKPAPALALSEGQRQTLQRLSRSTSAAHRLVVRSRALLLAGDGVANARIAAECGVAVSTVVGWRKRFAADGLWEFGRVAKGRGRKPSIPASKVEEIVRLTQEGRPDGETHWSCHQALLQRGVRQTSTGVQRDDVGAAAVGARRELAHE